MAARPYVWKNDSPLLQLLVVGSLLNQIKDLDNQQSFARITEIVPRTWLVSWAFAKGKALGLGVDIVGCCVVF